MSRRQNRALHGGRRGLTRFEAHSGGPRSFLTARPQCAAFRGVLPPHGAVGAPRVGRQRTTPRQRGSGEAKAPAASTAWSGQLEPVTGVRGREGLQEQRRSLRRQTRHANSSQCLRAGFTVPLPLKPGGCKDRGGGPPDPRWLHKTLFSPGHQVNIRRNQAGEGRGGPTGGGRNRPVDEDLVVPHPGDEVLSLFLGQGPLIIPKQLAGIAENQQLHSVPPTAGTSGSGLFLRAAFPLRFGTASARAVHDSVPGVQAGPLLRRADVPNASAWPTPSVKSAASRAQTRHRRHSGQQNGGSATSGDGQPYFRRAASADSLPLGAV